MSVPARLTWTPDSGEPETLDVLLPGFRVEEMSGLIGTPEWVASEEVEWIPVKQASGKYVDMLFRLALITKVERSTRGG